MLSRGGGKRSVQRQVCIDVPLPQLLPAAGLASGDTHVSLIKVLVKFILLNRNQVPCGLDELSRLVEQASQPAPAPASSAGLRRASRGKCQKSNRAVKRAQVCTYGSVGSCRLLRPNGSSVLCVNLCEHRLLRRGAHLCQYQDCAATRAGADRDGRPAGCCARISVSQ